MPKNVGVRVLDWALGRAEQVVLFTAEGAFSPTADAFDTPAIELLGPTPMRLRPEDLNRPILKILVIDGSADSSAAHELTDELQGFGAEVSSSVQGYVDICASGVHKARLLPNYLESVRCERGRKPYLVFVGDSFNDICCAALADESWTFQNSPDQLRQLATGLLRDNSSASLTKLFSTIQRSSKFGL